MLKYYGFIKLLTDFLQQAREVGTGPSYVLGEAWPGHRQTLGSSHGPSVGAQDKESFNLPESVWENIPFFTRDPGR